MADDIAAAEKDRTAWMEQAESIRTSGRWRTLNEQVVRLAENPQLRIQHFEGQENDWMFTVFGSLLSQVLEEYRDLKEAYEEKTKFKLSEIAWRTRNLLELSIWSFYCASDKDRARRFYEDAGRDMHSLADSYIKWGTVTNQGEDWLKDFVDAKENLKSKMTERGMTNLDDSYTKVSAAAKELGQEEIFRIGNRALSKFAHPTAALVMRPGSSDFDQQLGNSFFGQGCLYFCAAFDALEIGLGEPQKEAA